MRIQNKHPELHYMLCLGAGLRRANGDILRDDLPDVMRSRLEQLANTRAQPRAVMEAPTRPSKA